MNEKDWDTNQGFSANYWDTRYKTGETGWDMHQASPPLTGYIDSLSDTGLSILIPGCGNAYEADYLLKKGFQNVTLIDISKVLTDRLKEKYKDSAVTVICADYFTHSGTYDLILEQTFLHALPLSLRENYINHSAELLSENGKMAGVLFFRPVTHQGPPFISDEKTFRELFEKKFHINIMEECTNSIPPRAGNELFFEVVKR